MSKTAKAKAPEIFPIYLSDSRAYDLIKQYARDELEEGQRFKYNAYYEHSAKVLESGEVELSVWYRTDNGFCLSSGNCLQKTIKPFSAEELENLKARRMFAIAAEEFDRREDEKRVRAILKVQRELFGA